MPLRQRPDFKQALSALHRLQLEAEEDPELFLWTTGIGLILNQGNTLSEYEVSKKVIHLLRHSQKVHREEDGALHFWRRKENLQNQFPQSIHWSDDRWKACLAAGGGAKKRDCNTVLIIQEQLFFSELFKDIQDAILLILHYRTML